MMKVKSALRYIIGAQAEDGQAILLIALFMVVMLAMVGVAIDGGGLFLLWRDAQNAADTAALQAAYDKCTSADDTTWQGIGYQAADINGFDDTDDADAVGEDYSAANDVTVQMTDIGGTDYVHVVINAEKPAYFIQLVYSGPLEVTAEALVYCSGAVDFSDLPGIVGLGGCTCTGDGNARVAFTGSSFTLDGEAHSNCDMKVQTSANGSTALGLSSVGSISGQNKVEVPDDDFDEGADEKTLEVVIPIDLYFPGGEIYDAIDQTGGIVHYEPGSIIFDSSDGSLEGLWAVEGDVTIPTQFKPSGPDFGFEGLTIVSRSGLIWYKDSDRDSNWVYYGYNVDNPASSGHPGVTIEWSRGNGSAILAYSGMNIADPANDGTEPPNDGDETCNGQITGIQFTGSGDDLDIDTEGLVFAPWSHVEFSGSRLTQKGPVIGWGVNFSGAALKWIPEPDYLQPMAPVMNNAQ